MHFLLSALRRLHGCQSGVPGGFPAQEHPGGASALPDVTSNGSGSVRATATRAPGGQRDNSRVQAALT
ncbi:hypothetical protein DPMN_033480 [Dreissena polymorpha]|uniref:Uncharacterized protein n=1 Tax=Dreissena polymorpha TaxID=45954 RepID=A0A9D4RJW1_DREPO|nr:hypothetical protein DPMN_033480 [Dreissena polymorpha]